MQKMYKGKPVTVIRSAKAGDPGFVVPKTPPEQVLIRLQDSTQIVVQSTDLSDSPELVPVMKASTTNLSSAVTTSSTKSIFNIFKK